MKYFLMDTANYVSIIPCIVGFWCWRRLPFLMKGYLLGITVCTTIGIMSVITAKLGIHNHFIYPILAISTSLTLGFLFFHFPNNKILSYIIGSIFMLFALYIGFDFWKNGAKLFNFQLFTFLDISNLILSTLWIRKLINTVHLAKNYAFWLLFSIFLGALYDTLLTQLSDRWAMYFNNQWQNIVALYVSPIVQITKIGLLTYGFYLAGNRIHHFDRIPDL